MDVRFRGIRLGNFKAFSNAQDVPIRPITLLFGPNSAGKSSIIHSLTLIHEAMRTGSLDASYTKLGGTNIDLGGFARYVFNRDLNRNIEWAAVFQVRKDELSDASDLNGEIKVGITFGIPLDDLGKPVEDAPVSVVSYEILIDGLPFLRMSGRPQRTMSLDSLNVAHPLVVDFATTSMTSDSDAEDYDTSRLAQELLSNYEGAVVLGALLPNQLERSTRSTLFTELDNSEATDGWVLGLFASSISSLLADIETSLSSAFKTFEYLGPLRTYPERNLSFSENRDEDWYAGGTYAWDVVRTNDEVRKRVNQWLGSEWLQTPYAFSVEHLISTSGMRADITDFVDTFFNVEEPTSSETATSEQLADLLFDQLVSTSDQSADELVITDKRTETVVSNRDIGIGVSQVLPILVSSYATQNGLVMIEQPEIHLHPALQSELADVFIESALGDNKNTFVLETHSEHLMLRILRRIRESADSELPESRYPITPDDVSVLYIEPTVRGALVHHLPITEDGEFAEPWPQGFFAERARELY